MASTSRTIRVFVPFLKATIQVLQELTQEVFIKRNVYTHVGNLNGTDYQVEIGIIGDVCSRVIFSFPRSFAVELTRIMLDIGDGDVDTATVEESIQEIGNMVSGNAMGLLEEIGINADITPPRLYFPGESVVGERAQMGVLEFTSNIGNFQVAIVTHENNRMSQNDVIVSMGFPEGSNLQLAKFLFPKGIYFLGGTEANCERLFAEYSPSLILLNTNSQDFSKNLQALGKIQSLERVTLAIFGSPKEDILPPSLKSLNLLQVEEAEDTYGLLEGVKDILARVQISIYDNREGIVISVPKDSPHSAFLLLYTRRGDRETIPITQLSLDALMIDVSHHQYINFPERKNLSVKNDPYLRLGEETTVKIEKAQIGKTLSDNLVEVSLRHILETEIKKVTTYMYDVLSQ